MQDYLKQFTERALIATRAGDLERGKIQTELENLLADKPADASPEMAGYLEFLLMVVKGEDAEELWGKLPGDLQNIFGEVMKQLKGDDITEAIKDLTRKAVMARQKGEDKEVIAAELETILSSAPKEGSESMTRYLTYLLAIVRGTETEELASGIEQGLADIFYSVVEEVSGTDMMSFFERLTESVIKEAETGKPQQQISAQQVIKEMLEGENPPPQGIINYLVLLQTVLDGGDIDDKLLDVAPELQAIFKKYRG